MNKIISFFKNLFKKNEEHIVIKIDKHYISDLKAEEVAITDLKATVLKAENINLNKILKKEGI